MYSFLYWNILKYVFFTSKKPSIPTYDVRSFHSQRVNIISFFCHFLPKSMWLYNHTHTHIYKVEICNVYQWMVVTTKDIWIYSNFKCISMSLLVKNLKYYKMSICLPIVFHLPTINMGLLIKICLIFNHCDHIGK